MTKENCCNCIVCAKEFDLDEDNSVVMSKINYTQFKICKACIAASDPSDDYSQALSIINSYLEMTKAKQCFAEVKDIINSIKIST